MAIKKPKVVAEAENNEVGPAPKAAPKAKAKAKAKPKAKVKK